MADPEKEKISRTVTILNRWLVGLVAFSIIYTMVIFTVVEQNQEKLLKGLTPITLVDPSTLRSSYTNLIHPQLIQYATAGASNIHKESTTNGTSTNAFRPLFERKASYDVGDFAIVSYFYIQGVIVEKLPNDVYVVMYKDHNHVLQKVSISKDFIVVPTSNYAINPASLLVD
jgi:hypothetical protein